MALVNVVNMAVLDNPSPFTSPLSFEITFECLRPLADDLEWRVLYVGSAEDTTHDQVLDEVLVGPVPVGVNKFVLQADPPDVSKIPENDVLGVTVVLVTCNYRGKEFVRVGYYVSNEYAEPYDEETGPPKPLDLGKVRRAVLADKPRVTRFQIKWEDAETSPSPRGVQGLENEPGARQGQQVQDDLGMALDQMGNGDMEEFDDDEDDVSVEGRDMMLEDLAMGNVSVVPVAME